MIESIGQESIQVDFKTHIAKTFPSKVDKIALLVSSEYEGYYKNGGIGTYYRALSEQLFEDGWYVILLLCATEEHFQGKSKVPFLNQVFSVTECEEILSLQPIHRAILDDARSSYYEYQSFNILFFTQALVACCANAKVYIEFPEMCGFGYRTIQAKRVGLLPKCVTSVTLHSGHEWVYEANERFNVTYAHNFWQICHYEQNSFENADLSFHPSNFILSKVKSYGWNVSAAIRLPYFIPLINLSCIETPLIESLKNRIAENKIPIIFFARLEERKGLCTFIQAIKRLESSSANSCHFIFVGKIVQLNSHHLRHLDSDQYIRQELTNTYSYDICDGLFSEEALNLINSFNRAIVCLTSPQDNFPNSALEVGQLPVSIVAADTGGFRETLGLLNRDSCVYWFQPQSVQSLTQVLSKSIENYNELPNVPKIDLLQDTNVSLLQKRIEYIDNKFEFGRKETQTYPLVIVTIVVKDGDLNLLDCLGSLYAQVYQNFQVIVLDLAVENEETQKVLRNSQTKFPSIKVVHCSHASDLTSLQEWIDLIQQSSWLLFWNANNLSSVNMLDTLVNSAISADALVSLCPALVNSQNLLVQNMRLGYVSQLLTSGLSNVNMLLSTKLMFEHMNWPIGFEVGSLAKYLLATVITTGEKIAYFPYPLYLDISKNTNLDKEVLLKDSFQMRQYIASIEPLAWNERQIYMLLSGLQQIEFQSGFVQSFKNLAGYDIKTLFNALAWKVIRIIQSRISKYENMKLISFVRIRLIKFFSGSKI
ncbi:glycosyltransferase family 4 protein [Pseudanabaena sp. FACHB-1277]|jgi:glycosyltransferase involved in cell wall biosynthesis|uniref:Glycosyltransferase family 4 protein n=1 Tax=Pseudanabaena cinerea FACHB-1277 TaxID=2949581 RepID=A0A926Z5W6_9CYAN|nr:glycosyltransferase family 4 protein [Pseudanabaena cinerea]MBD2150110.1 glycosyltransferase family 4 protein [Pseudanabaena cinerea FACHB-1277]